MDEVFDDAVDVGEIGFTTVGGRRADAEERDFGVLQCVSGPDRRVERAAGDRFRNEGLQPGLDHRTVTGRDGRDLQFVRIDSPDVVTVRSQTSGGDGADITKPEDGDLHAFGRRGAGASPQRDGVMYNMSRAAPLRYT